MWQGSARTRRAWRQLTLGSGPLKRRSDRLEVGARVLLAVLVLLSVPVSVLVGRNSATDLRAEAAAQAADRHSVTGTLLADAARSAEPDGTGLVRAPVAYRVASGPRSGVILVPAGTGEGTPVELWVTRAGRITTPPMDPQKVTAQGVGIGLAVFCGIGTVAVLGFLLFRRLLNLGRMRRWTSGWAVVEPRWSGKVR